MGGGGSRKVMRKTLILLFISSFIFQQLRGDDRRT